MMSISVLLAKFEKVLKLAQRNSTTSQKEKGDCLILQQHVGHVPMQAENSEMVIMRARWPTSQGNGDDSG
jgi:hypothetical protein